ncbi:transcription initiation factor TFIID subunit 4 isoform X4 [Drosophila eugracilis]|uniref:transcription initiation factor TFIID subunit 4 isoform X4 n=1 Tax=Drosophila eugracilis TaxID=29029 RepID=UPI0007E6B8F9|nr:transcription initiation factor TFIID subunit 4 isoform X4 [Drosophila eugracilis]
MNTSQTAAGNRITFTSQPLPNGTINIAGNPGAVISTAQLPNTTTIKTIQAGIGGQHQGLQQVHHVQQQQAQQQQQTQSAGQPMLNSMLPAGVVVGMRHQAPSQQQQKNVPTNPLSRVVINSHMAGVRPQSPSITLSSLNTGQTPALLVKTDNGFQLLRVGTTTGPPTVTQTITNTSNNSNTTSTTNHPTTTQIRLQTVPAAASMTNTTATSNIIVNSVASSYANSSQPPHLTQLNAQAPHLPQITQIQTIPAQQSQQQANNVSSGGGVATAVSSTTAATTTQQGNTKEKCRKFLANLIELSTREPKPVEKNVRTLIQELVNANVEPEEFCDRLERLLNASPQPCLIGFLKKSLPLLRQALYTKELVIEGIKPPPQHVLGLAGLSQQLPKIQAQIRPIGPSQTTTIGQTQVRMITPNALGAPRPTIGHTTISKQPPNIRLPTAPRLVNTGGIRTQIPSLQVPGQANIVQIRGPQHAQLQRTGAVQIRATTRPPNSAPTANKLTAVKVGQTQIKAITPSLHPPSLAAISGGPPPTPTLSVLSTLNSASTTSLPIPSLPTVHLPPEALRAREQMQNSLNHNNNHFEAKLVEIKAPSLHPPHMERINASLTPIGAKTIARPPPAINKTIGKKKRDAMEMDAKLNSLSGAAASAANSFFQQSSMSSMYGDDDINDVAAMGGVNLAEESQRILGCTENIGTQIRSCKDEVFLNLPALQARIRAITSEAGLDEPSQDVAVLISHACQERLKNIVEKLAVIAEHRIDVIKLDPRYEPAKDVRGQIKFLEELDKAEQKRHEELEREMLLRAAKSRSRVEDPEQAKMKARAKEMQRAEMEELRQRDANLTALQAIGPRKKLKLDGEAVSAGVGSSGGGVLSGSGTAPTTLRPRIKRVNLRDMLFYMEQEREFCRSSMLFKTYLK